MVRRSAYLLAILFSLVWRSAVSAGIYNGFLEEVWVNGAADSDVGWIQVSGEIISPACGNNKWYVVDLLQNGTKMAHIFALTAHVTGKEVKLGGSGYCQGVYEKLQYIVVK